MDFYLGGDCLAQSLGLKNRCTGPAISIPIPLRHCQLWNQEVCLGFAILGDPSITRWLGADISCYIHSREFVVDCNELCLQ